MMADREIFGLQRDDICYSWFCPLCVLCQGINEYDVDVKYCCEEVVDGSDIGNVVIDHV